MRAIILLVVVALLLLVALGVIVALRALEARRNSHKLAHAKWEPVEYSKGGHYYVKLLKVGQEPIQIARLDFRDSDFESYLHEARAQAVQEAIILNRPAKLLV